MLMRCSTYELTLALVRILVMKLMLALAAVPQLTGDVTWIHTPLIVIPLDFNPLTISSNCWYPALEEAG